MGSSIGPMATSTNPDGSTKWIFVQTQGSFNGFAVVDFATHEEIKRIKNPDIAPGHHNDAPNHSPSHGLAVTSDGKTLVVANR